MVAHRWAAALARALLMGAVCVPAPWVPLNQVSPQQAKAPTDKKATYVPQETIALTLHRLSLVTSKIPPSLVGNVQGSRRLPELKSARNRALVASMGMGTPPQKVDFLLDASGSDIWVPSRRCATCAKDSAEQRTFYNASASSTFVPRIEKTPYGEGPLSARIIYGGGSASGYVVTDTLQFGPVALRKQDFLIAEGGGPDARKSRVWDGVFGIGWQSRASQDEAAPQYKKLAMERGLQAMYSIVPLSSGKGASMYVGKLPPESIVSSADIAWTPALRPRSPWIVHAKVAVGSGQSHSVEAVVDSSTSFLLAPPHTYLSFVRSLLPTFDRRCGLHTKAGNLVICECAARTDLPAHEAVKFSLPDSGGSASREFTVAADDLFERIENSQFCVFQIQQRPLASKVDDPFGLLGAPLLDEPRPPLMDGIPPPFLNGMGLGPAGPFGIPMGLMPDGPDGLSPIDRSKEHAPYGAINQPFESPFDILQNLTKALDTALGSDGEQMMDGKMPHGGVVKEVVVESLGDGSRCETEVVRNNKGKILEENTTVIGPGGRKKVSKSHVECQGTRVKSRRLQPLEALPLKDFLADHLSSIPSDLWVIGDVLLRKYAVVLDFGGERLGIAVPKGASVPPAGAPSTVAVPPVAVPSTSNGVEALESSGPVMQSWEAKRSQPPSLRASASKLAVASSSGGSEDPSVKGKAEDPSASSSVAGSTTFGLLALALMAVILVRYQRVRRSPVRGPNGGEDTGLRLPDLDEDDSVFE